MADAKDRPALTGRADVNGRAARCGCLSHGDEAGESLHLASSALLERAPCMAACAGSGSRALVGRCAVDNGRGLGSSGRNEQRQRGVKRRFRRTQADERLQPHWRGGRRDRCDCRPLLGRRRARLRAPAEPPARTSTEGAVGVHRQACARAGGQLRRLPLTDRRPQRVSAATRPAAALDRRPEVPARVEGGSRYDAPAPPNTTGRLCGSRERRLRRRDPARRPALPARERHSPRRNRRPRDVRGAFSEQPRQLLQTGTRRLCRRSSQRDFASASSARCRRTSTTRRHMRASTIRTLSRSHRCCARYCQPRTQTPPSGSARSHAPACDQQPRSTSAASFSGWPHHPEQAHSSSGWSSTTSTVSSSISPTRPPFDYILARDERPPRGRAERAPFGGGHRLDARP
jgi:hypothetical protein